MYINFIQSTFQQKSVDNEFESQASNFKLYKPWKSFCTIFFKILNKILSQL